MAEDEMVGGQVQASFDLLPSSDEFDVVYLEMISMRLCRVVEQKSTLAIRVLSILVHGFSTEEGKQVVVRLFEFTNTGLRRLRIRFGDRFGYFRW